MALDPSNVLVAVTGAFYADTSGSATAPTSTSSALTSYTDLGLISEDGITLSMPGAGDSTSLKAWQNGQTVRVIRTPSEDNPTIQLVFIETKLDVIEFTFGVSVTQTSTDGSWEIDTTEVRTPVNSVIDVVDGAEILRAHLPKAVVTEISEISLTSTDAIGWGVTLELERDNTLGYQAKVWSTKLKTVA